MNGSLCHRATAEAWCDSGPRPVPRILRVLHKLASLIGSFKCRDVDSLMPDHVDAARSRIVA